MERIIRSLENYGKTPDPRILRRLERVLTDMWGKNGFECKKCYTRSWNSVCEVCLEEESLRRQINHTSQQLDQQIEILLSLSSLKPKGPTLEPSEPFINPFWDGKS